MTAEQKHFVTKDFPLSCFVPKSREDLSLQGSYTVEGRKVSFSFFWSGSLATKIQGIQNAGKYIFDEKKRQDELWKKTCFELFVSPGQKSSAYQEVNLSPAGAWNVYSFDSERVGMVRSQNLLGVPFSQVQFSVTEDSCVIHLDFSQVRTTEELSFRVGMTAVLQIGPEMTYWAMAHFKEKPDFHDRNSWTGVLYV